MYKLETHLHTAGQSPCSSGMPGEIAEIYSSLGYNGIVCTNHFMRLYIEHYYKFKSEKETVDYFLKGYSDLKAACAPKNIDVFLGMELNPDEFSYMKSEQPRAELLLYGITPEFVEKYGFSLLTLPHQELFAICEENNFLLSQSHPFRDNISAVNPEFLHAVEVFNGHPGHNSRNDKAAEFCKANKLIPLAGSDFHGAGSEGCGIYLKNEVHDNLSLVNEIKKNTHILITK